MFEDTRLRIFAEVAGSGSFTRAAKALGISQPAVSQNISELERIVGEPLFERSRGEISLTAKGKLFLSYTNKILYWYAKADAVCISGTEAPAEPVRLSLGEKTVEFSELDGEINLKIL